MRIQLNPSPIFKTKWYEYATRFLLGGSITVCAGLIADKWGPGVGGLFLAFPSTFRASVTLIAKHEKESKQTKGLSGAKRAKNAAAVDAAGASIGSIGLMAFAFVGSALLPGRSALSVLLLGTFAWFLVSIIVWLLRKAI
jgi:Protein of unknown function (DUF3147)